MTLERNIFVTDICNLNLQTDIHLFLNKIQVPYIFPKKNEIKQNYVSKCENQLKSLSSFRQ